MTITMRERAETATREILDTLKNGPMEAHGKEIADAIEIAITKALLDERARCADVAARCCGPEADKAHQIREEVNRVNAALIANLESMR